MHVRMLTITFIVLLMLIGSGLEMIDVRSTQPSTEHASTEQADPVADATLKMAYSETLGQGNLAYHFQANTNGYTANNPAHQLAVDVSRDRVLLSVNNDTWQLYSHNAAHDFSIEGNRLTIHHAGYDEWYVNGPLGLQQGFTLYEPSVIAYDVGGTLSTSATNHTLTMGDSLTFSGLMAYDAAGQDVPVAFELLDDKLAYVYDDAAATYPITIDPWVQQVKLVASDGVTYANFGYSVALDGDTALIGAQQDDDNGQWSGSAYVFVRSGTTWSEQAKLLPSDGAANERFGQVVALSNDTAVVGANGVDGSGIPTGTAYVFVRSGTTWSEQAKLLPSDGAAFDNFGTAVALSGDTALIGAWADDDNGTNSGSAYVFVRSGTTWSQQVKIIGGAAYNLFGQAVSLDGDTALVGSWGDSIYGDGSGSAYIFVRSGTTWSQQAKLIPSEGAELDRFGYAVSMSGDTALIGAYLSEHNGPDSGSAYVFVRSGTTWSQQARLLPNEGSAVDHFGYGVSVNGDTALIGAPRDDPQGVNSGSAYIFRRSGTVWTQQAQLLRDIGSSAVNFGSSVALSGKYGLVGVPFDSPNGSDSGSAYIFNGPTVLSASAACYFNNLEVTIQSGEGPFNITGTGTGLPLNGISIGTHTFTGPGTWTGVTVSETTGNTESANLGDFLCPIPTDTPTPTFTPTDTFTPSPTLPPPTNDDATSPIDIPPMPPSYTNAQEVFGTTKALDDPPMCTANYGSTVWYRYTAPLDQTVTFDTIGSTYDTVLAVYTGIPGAFTMVVCNDDSFGQQSEVQYTASGGTTYYVMVARYGGDVGSPSTLVLNGSAVNLVTPTDTPITPTDTLAPPTDTLVPPSDTPVTPTDTPVTPTDTPITPTDTPITPSDTPVTPTDTPVTPTDTPVTPVDTPTFTATGPTPGGEPLQASAQCVGNDLEITISSGDGFFDILFDSGPPGATPFTNVRLGVYTSSGPGTWTNLRVVETIVNFETVVLGDFTCGTITDTPPPPTNTPTGPEVLVVSAVCNVADLEVTITDGDGPFDITASAGINTPVLGVSLGTTTIIGPEKWDNLTVSETTGDTEAMNLGQFKCRTDERPTPLTPAHRERTTNTFPVFSWTAVSFASNYRVFVFDNKVVADRTVDIRENSGGATSYTLSQPLPLGRLFWRVRARTNRVWGLWSERFTLFIDPPAVAPITPVPTIDLSDGDSGPQIPPTPVTLPTFPPPPNSR